MRSKNLNTRALRRAIAAISGEQGAVMIDALYSVLDAAEREIEAELTAADVNEYKDGFNDGFRAGYDAAQSAFYDTEQPTLVITLPDLSKDVENEEELVKAVTMLDAPKTVQ